METDNNTYRHGGLVIAEEVNYWTVFVDAILSLFIVAVFTIVYDYFSGGDNLELLAVRAKQSEFLEAFEKEFAKEISDGKITHSINGNIQRLSFGEELLFGLGSDTLKNNGKLMLNRCLGVFSALGNNSQLYDQIMVEGHTDSVSIRKFNNLWKSGIRDNWDLSAARSNNVVRYFIGQSRLNPALFSSAAYSWYQWKRETEPPMSRNRKIEIVLVYSANWKNNAKN
ncbi:hypothetical protein C7N43_23365 [Sphingobacteriales bacterium UPWRP_1]|nr:hypothetical protein BVG80_07510 [Sphingobacteriales bacterium TSM_CSM]PSJ74582.1 hypothetical protein C7N43_23365 [Sphingobacteriales bacterium UPWRP_1]